MLGNARVVAFAAVSDTARAKTFYGGVPGLSLVQRLLSRSSTDANGTHAARDAGGHGCGAPYTVVGWGVADIADAVRGLTKAGVTFERYPGMEQDKLGIWQSPSRAKVAGFEDPNGNTLSVTEF